MSHLTPLRFAAAVFKPQDEEPGAASNPRGHGAGSGDASLRRGVRPGEGAVREVAAYVLDRNHFAGVPPTALVSVQPQPIRSNSTDSNSTAPGQLSESAGIDSAGVSQQSDSSASDDSGPYDAPGLGVKVGSLQQFVHSDGDCEDRGPSAFPVHEVRVRSQIIRPCGRLLC